MDDEPSTSDLRTTLRNLLVTLSPAQVAHLPSQLKLNAPPGALSFAVVAHEVKALAGQTAKATADISENVAMIQASTRNAVDAVREIGGAVREINEVTTVIAGAVSQQDAATREISSNAQSAAQGNETLAANITSLRDAIGETDTAATSVLAAASSLTATADTLSREVEKFFQNLRADSRIAKAG